MTYSQMPRSKKPYRHLLALMFRKRDPQKIRDMSHDEFFDLLRLVWTFRSSASNGKPRSRWHR